VIIAKHRNGPTAQVALTFLSKYPKFANLYRERTTELPVEGNGAG
jgi:hypothetical protein